MGWGKDNVSIQRDTRRGVNIIHDHDRGVMYATDDNHRTVPIQEVCIGCHTKPCTCTEAQAQFEFGE